MENDRREEGTKQPTKLTFKEGTRAYEEAQHLLDEDEPSESDDVKVVGQPKHYKLRT